MKKLISFLAVISVLFVVFPAQPAEAFSPSGFCAIGEVEETNNTAVALFSDGSVKVVRYLGDNPSEGEVYIFKTSNNKYIFSSASFMPDYPNNYSPTSVIVSKNLKQLYLPNWGHTYIKLTNADSAFFVRYSNTSWRVFSGADMLKAENKATTAFVRADFRDQSNISFTCGLIGTRNADTKEVIAATAAQTSVFDENGTGWSYGNKDLSFSAQGLNEPSALVGARYCAVGEVDTLTKRVSVLFGDGTVSTVYYGGESPNSGEIYSCRNLTDKIYSFDRLLFEPGYSKEVSNWEVRTLAESKQIMIGTGETLETNNETIYFARYTDTSWRVFSGNDAVKSSGFPCKGYLSISNSYLNRNRLLNVMLIGDYDTQNSAVIPTDSDSTKFFDSTGIGFTMGDKTLTLEPVDQAYDINKDNYFNVLDVITGKNILLGKKEGKISIAELLSLKDSLLGYEVVRASALKMNKNTSLAMLEYKAAPITGYSTHSDGGLIYNPLSREAFKTGNGNKYNNVVTRQATIKTNDFDAQFQFPADVTAYDMIPIDYTIKKKNGNFTSPLSVVSTAFEEAGRGQGDMYDLSVPGYMDINFEYLGYVTGTMTGNRQIMKPDNTDTPADAYPNYTTTELSTSGTVLAGDIVWLKFQYTNTGKTILDLEGVGGFTMEPVLMKKDSTGNFVQVGSLYNEFVRELTYVYPGETRDFWLCFNVTDNTIVSPESHGLNMGDYRVDFTVYYRTEYNYEPYTTIWKGYTMQKSSYAFSVSTTLKYTAPQPVSVEYKDTGSENKSSWYHYFEEFMTTYEQYRADSGQAVLRGRLWLQVAPFTNQLVFKIIYANPKKIARSVNPITVNKEIDIEYDADNINVVVGKDGLAYPAVQAQPMSDMRANVEVSPYPEETIVRDLLDMKKCGINLLNTQGAPWLFDSNVPYANTALSNLKGDSLRYMLDLARNLGFKLDGMGTYSYGRPTIANSFYWLKGTFVNLILTYPGEADYGDNDVASLTAPVYLYQRSRWGDLYWSDSNGISSYTVEDTRGFMRYESHIRYAIGELGKDKFRDWLRKKYRYIWSMNYKWGTSYKSFDEVDPERGQQKWETDWGTWYIYNNAEDGFYEWSPAMIDLDEFRTDLRLQNYEDCLAEIRTVDKSSMFQMRTEGSSFAVPGLDPTEDNDHYRSIIYTQLREASVAEKIVASDTVRSYADYVTLPLTPSEVRTVVKKSVDNGIIPMLMPQFDNMRDIAINDTYGIDYTAYYNLTESKKGALVHTLIAVFPWWKATYEEGGVPGILWQDLQCDGIVTETQQKEMKFFNERLQKMLNQPEVLKQRKRQTAVPEISIGKYTYNKNFITAMVETVQREYNN